MSAGPWCEFAKGGGFGEARRGAAPKDAEFSTFYRTTVRRQVGFLVTDGACVEVS
ncbi:hypothetical protein [Streptomyces sp. SAS_276]|uniref:hypothetical protein n=1 Tax=Streptomyces sp. SAS_276 TaxID=3412745 RepID=UPI00403C4B7B